MQTKYFKEIVITNVMKWTQIKNITAPKKQQNYSESVPRPLKDGVNQAKLNILNQEKKIQDTEEGTALTEFWESKTDQTIHVQRLEEESVTLEYLQEARKTILQDRSSTLNLSSLSMKLLQTLEVDLTSRGKVLTPFWNQHIKEKSKRLWLPTKTDCVDLDQNLLKTPLLNAVKVESWYSTIVNHHHTKNLPQTSYPFLQFSQPVQTDCESTKIKSRKIRIFPTKKQKKILEVWFGMYRWFYNRAVEKMEENTDFNFQRTRNDMRNEQRRFELPEWVENKKLYCSKIISEAVHDVSKNYKTSFANLKAKNISNFKMHFKTKKQRMQHLTLEKSCFRKKDNAILPTFLGKMRGTGYVENGLRVLYSEIKIDCDCSIIYDKRLKTYTLVVPMKEEKIIKCENQAPYEFISLDTGVRTFQTGYCPSGHTLEIGKDASKKLIKLLEQKDILRSKADLCRNKRKKQKIWRSFFKKQKRIENLIDEIHFKTCDFLTSTYKTVMLPVFETSQMIKQRKLGKMTKRLLTIFQYYKFKQRLLEKAKWTNTKIMLVDESFTSKTCTGCGWYNTKLGSSKIFKCNECKLIIDRDINGARNIALKNSS